MILKHKMLTTALLQFSLNICCSLLTSRLNNLNENYLQECNYLIP